MQKYCQKCAYNKYYKPSKPIKRMGKVAKRWATYRDEWFKLNPPDHQGYYTCGICFSKVHIDETTLDHIIPRSSRQDLRFIDSNIQPAHWRCNGEKGSKHANVNG